MNFDLALAHYLYSLLPFLFQIVIAEGIFVFGLKRRKFFIVRLVSGLTLCAAAAFLVSVLMALVPHFLFGSAMYIVMFSITLLVLWQCFDEKIGTLLFCGVAAYTAQNMAYRLYCIAEVNGLVWRLAEHVGWRWASEILSDAALIAVYVAVFFLFARRIKKYSLARLHSRNILLISALTLSVTVLLCSWTNNYYWHHMMLLTINFVFSFLCCVFILSLQWGMLENLGLRQDIEVIRQMWRNDKRQYEISKQSMDIVNIKCHDLKHRIKGLRAGDGISEEELEEMEKAVKLYDARVSTGCIPLDVILTEKSMQCQKSEINLSCMADGKSLSFMRASELYTLFGNMFSNAIEAVEKVSDKSRRLIDFTVRRIGDMLIIQIENYFDGQIRFKDGLPLTSSADRVNHGYGMKSMKMLTQKYGGEMSVSADCDVYRLKIMLPVPDAKEAQELKDVG